MNFTLRVNENPTPVEQFAAEELVRYLQQAVEVCPYTFVVGVEDTVQGPEGLRIRITADTVYLQGSPDGEGRGVLYAVYEFLERYVGCVLAAYGNPEVPMGEIIPHHHTLTLSEQAYEKTADLPYRTAIVQFHFWVGNVDRGLTLPFIDWLAKNRFNRILTWTGCYEQMIDLGLILELTKRGIRLSVGHHQAISTWLPPYGNRYFETAYATEHPEYYRLEADGSRRIPKAADDYDGQLLLCCRNEDCIQAMADNILCWLEQNPLVDTVALWPHDGKKVQCCCSACVKHSKVENYLYFENEVARRITEKRKDVKVDVLVYMDLWQCPEDITLCDGILIDQATWSQDGMRTCGKPDGGSLINTYFEKNLMGFRKKCRHAVYYDYYMGNFGNQQRVMPAADEMQSVFQNMVKLGLDGSGTQMECFNHWNNLFNFYCFARTAYDTGLSMEDQLDRFIPLFGEGGELIKEILHIYEATLDGQVPINDTGDFFIANVDQPTVYALFDQALERTTDPICRNNIRMMRMAFRYSHLFTEDKNRKKNDIQTVECNDESGELTYMATTFDSYYANHTGYGIAIRVKNRTDKLPEALVNDPWYQFDK